MCTEAAIPKCLTQQKTAQRTFEYRGFETFIVLLINISSKADLPIWQVQYCKERKKISHSNMNCSAQSDVQY